MKKWKCTVCGYVHTGAKPPKKCPVCGVGSEKFIEMDEEVQQTDQERQAIQKVLFNCTYGLYVITSYNNDDKINGMTSNSFVQMTDTPMQAVVGINKNNLTNEYIDESGVFAVSFLGQDNHDEVRMFGYSSGRDRNKFIEAEYRRSPNLKLPVLTNSIGYVECKVQRDKCVDLGSHTLFVATVVGGEIFNEKEPMSYAYYRATK